MVEYLRINRTSSESITQFVINSSYMGPQDFEKKEAEIFYFFKG